LMLHFSAKTMDLQTGLEYAIPIYLSRTIHQNKTKDAFILKFAEFSKAIAHSFPKNRQKTAHKYWGS
jgi:hypothetical protein